MLQVAVARPQQAHAPHVQNIRGVGVGVLVLATIADNQAEIQARVPDTKALAHHLVGLCHLYRPRAPRTQGSARHGKTSHPISILHARIAKVRGDAINELAADLAKTQGRIVVEGLKAAGMLRQKGLARARSRRRGLSAAALAQVDAHLAHKCGWCGSELGEGDRWIPSSQLCHWCRHQRDDDGAFNLAGYQNSGWRAVGPVGPFVKRGAEGKTGPRPAAGVEAQNPCREGVRLRGLTNLHSVAAPG